jgi:hypothetical protein
MVLAAPQQPVVAAAAAATAAAAYTTDNRLWLPVTPMMIPAITSTSMPMVLAMPASLSLRFRVHRGTKAAATQLQDKQNRDTRQEGQQ